MPGLNNNIMTRAEKKTTPDWLLIFIYSLIVIFGYFNLYSSDYQATIEGTHFLHTTYGKQLLFIFISIILAIFIMFIDPVAFPMFAYIIYIAVLSVLLLVFIFGVATHGARSWLEIGTFKIQPSEFAKFATTIALARFVSINEFNLKNKINTLITFGIIGLPVILILLQPDVGSAMVYVAFILVLYREGMPGTILLYILILIITFVLTLILNPIIILSSLITITLILIYIELKEKKNFSLVILPLLLIFSILYITNLFTKLNIGLIKIITFSTIIWSIYLSIYFLTKRQKTPILILFFLFSAIATQLLTSTAFHKILKPHQRDRIEVLFDNSIDPQGIGYQIRQSKIAIGSGGFTGKGYLKGTQTKLDFVPEHNTDFIFCTIAEEWGFTGAIILFVLYSTLLFRIIHKAEQQLSSFSRIYGYSLAAILFFHFFVNIGMTLGLLPVIGIPLPFLSYGGSAMLGFTALFFIFIKLDTVKDLQL